MDHLVVCVAHFSSTEIVTAYFYTQQGIAGNRICTALFYDRLALIELPYRPLFGLNLGDTNSGDLKNWR